jgi:hypothetical protein
MGLWNLPSVVFMTKEPLALREGRPMRIVRRIRSAHSHQHHEIYNPIKYVYCKKELPDLRPVMSSVNVAYARDDMETLGIAQQYVRLFERSGLPSNIIPIFPSGPEQEGLVILVADTANIPTSVTKFREALDIANIHTTLMAVNGKNRLYGDDFVFFVAPAHQD